MIGNTASRMPLSRVGCFCAVAAGSVVVDQAVMPDYAFIVGSPAKVHSTIDPANPKHIMRLSRTYIEGDHGIAALARSYIEQGIWEHRDD